MSVVMMKLSSVRMLQRAKVFTEEALLAEERADFQSAKENYISAVSCYPHTTKESLLNLGWMFFEEGDIDDACYLWFASLNIDPKYAKALYNLGIYFWDTGYLDEAKGYFERSLEIEDDFNTRFNLGHLCSHMGFVLPAIAHLNKYLEMRPNSIVYEQVKRDIWNLKQLAQGK